MPLVGVDGGGDLGLRIGEDGLGLAHQAGLMGLARQETVRPRVADRLRGVGVAGDGIDQDERAFGLAPAQQTLLQERDRGLRAGPVRDRLPVQHQHPARGEGRNRVQRGAPVAVIMTAAQGLAVDGHPRRRAWPKGGRPRLDHPGKQRRIDPVAKHLRKRLTDACVRCRRRFLSESLNQQRFQTHATNHTDFGE